ncbi:MAG TPA: hypothetical protein VMT37_04375 [Solirubrobacterales bacterium]|nr:hypothetical protein [Solirubrobacterales bacterium]
MKSFWSRPAYANVIATLALFLVLAGGTAFAASKLAKGSVGTKQIKANAVTGAKIKKNAVTGAKVKNGSLTGADINLATLGTVPTAAALAGQTAFETFMGPGTQNVGTFGAFTIQAQCKINEAATDYAEFLLSTSEDHSAMDNNSGPENDDFGPADNPIRMFFQSAETGKTNIEAEGGALLAMAPGGTVLISERQELAVNPPGHLGQCYFAAIFKKVK